MSTAQLVNASRLINNSMIVSYSTPKYIKISQQLWFMQYAENQKLIIMSFQGHNNELSGWSPNIRIYFDTQIITASTNSPSVQQWSLSPDWQWHLQWSAARQPYRSLGNAALCSHHSSSSVKTLPSITSQFWVYEMSYFLKRTGWAKKTTPPWFF